MKVDLNKLEEIKWEFCLKAIAYYKACKALIGSPAYKYLTELEKELKQFLKEQE